MVLADAIIVGAQTEASSQDKARFTFKKNTIHPNISLFILLTKHASQNELQCFFGSAVFLSPI